MDENTRTSSDLATNTHTYGGRERGRERADVQCGLDTLGRREVSEERSLHSELFLDAPQGLGALHQLLLLFGLQRHVDHVGQAAVAQDAGDAQEDLILYSVQALKGESR